MLRRLSEQDHYQVLEVSHDASSDEIQSAFETARDIYSHEALVSSSILSDRERRRTFHQISEAYQTLIAEESRRLYDKRLGVSAVRPTRKFLSTPAVSDGVRARRCRPVRGPRRAGGGEPPARVPDATRARARSDRSVSQSGASGDGGRVGNDLERNENRLFHARIYRE